MQSEAEQTVLWWSRSGRDYSRDRIVRTCLAELGWSVIDFQPKVSSLGATEASLRRIPATRVVWVPCFRQRDVAAAARWAGRRRIPLIFDPLISAYDKQVFERKKFPEESRRARRLLQQETQQFATADVLIADTELHADYFSQTHGIARDKITVVPVGAEESVFQPAPQRRFSPPLRALFYGSFIELQGPEFITRAAVQTPGVQWTFIGSGPLLEQCQRIAADAAHITWSARVPYETLNARIADSDVVLGVFGTGRKAGRVIPNKVYQPLACGRPVVSRLSDAYPEEIRSSDADNSGIVFVPPGDPKALSDAVCELADSPQRLSRAAAAARATYERFFSYECVRSCVAAALDTALRRSRNNG